jgi:hypothetical protein
MSRIILTYEIPSHDREWLQFSLNQIYDTNCNLFRKIPYLSLPNPKEVKFDPSYNMASTDGVNTLIINGKGECKDFAAAIAAYFTVRLGIPSTPVVVPLYNDGIQIKGRWHAVVNMKGQEYDPNYLYGMTKSQK